MPIAIEEVKEDSVSGTDEFVELVLGKKKEGRAVVYVAEDAIASIPLDELCNQPADGILYDLNRDESSVLASAEDGNPYWVNNFAAAQVIRFLCGRVEELEKMIKEKDEAMKRFVSSVKD